MNRICPPEELLSEYLAATLNREDTELVEEHLIYCETCRTAISDAYKILRHKGMKDIFSSMRGLLLKNIWISVSIAALAGSFIFRGYFIQFLTVSVLTGIKWLVDTRTTKTLVMINEKWKQHNNPKITGPRRAEGERNEQKNTI